MDVEGENSLWFESKAIFESIAKAEVNNMSEPGTSRKKCQRIRSFKNMLFIYN